MLTLLHLVTPWVCFATIFAFKVLFFIPSSLKPTQSLFCGPLFGCFSFFLIASSILGLLADILSSPNWVFSPIMRIGQFLQWDHQISVIFSSISIKVWIVQTLVLLLWQELLWDNSILQKQFAQYMHHWLTPLNSHGKLADIYEKLLSIQVNYLYVSLSIYIEVFCCFFFRDKDGR